MEALFAYALALEPIIGFLALLCVPAKKRKYAWLVGVAYVVVYLPFSPLGRFQTSNHGGMDWQDEWLPRGLAEPYRRQTVWPNDRITRGRTKTRLTYAGNLFWPIIILDNLFWLRAHQSDLARG